ncbi:hypothetical protein TNCV_3173411 [Trichonephila clavipes]|nr:hypothetical protein TNCV_3173411 [Trichonephila clavipes]
MISPELDRVHIGERTTLIIYGWLYMLKAKNGTTSKLNKETDNLSSTAADRHLESLRKTCQTGCMITSSSYTALASVFYTVYQGNSTNTCNKALLKSSTVAKASLPVAIERPRTSYTCFTGPRLGDIAGHSNP